MAAIAAAPSRIKAEGANLGSPPRRADWRRTYARRLFVTDLAALVWVVGAAEIALYGGVELPAETPIGPLVGLVFGFPVLLLVSWQAALALADTRAPRVAGFGSGEYERVFDATFMVFGVTATLAYVFDVESIKPFLFLTVPLGLLALFVERWLWRLWLRARRLDGEYCSTVLLVGSSSSVREIAEELGRTAHAGYRVVGATVPGGAAGDMVAGTSVPIVGDPSDVQGAMAVAGADTVVVTSADVLTAHRVQEISWELRPGEQYLVLAPSIVGVGDPRLHARPVAGLPLLHVDTPELSRGNRFLKRSFDVAVSAVLLALLSPILIALAIAVRATSPGPILYRSERIGLGGEPFAMLKFRSMRPGADRELAALLREQGTSETPLFKVQNDPRITPIGRILRKYSLDELPQLLNVLGGSMSLVGPRPQIAAEVAMYTDSAKRRLLTRPGVTGLWQVSGRSALTWDDAVRLDLYYVENWSLLGDVSIMLRTFKAVLAPGETAH